MQMHGIGFPAPAEPGSISAVTSTVLIAIDGAPAAVLAFADPLRADGGNALRELRACGIERVVLATGDRQAVAEALVAGLPSTRSSPTSTLWPRPRPSQPSDGTDR